MVRVKLPMGGVTPDQLDAFADVIEKYVPLRKGHITTRQNIQMHHVPLPDAAKLIRELGDAGLSSREGCGNTMRNVTGDPRAGTLEDELFDITPYAGAYVRYFVRHPTTQAMPRKVKTAFAATDADNAITQIHDMAFIPRERDGVRGVEVRVGGGTSIMPRMAPTLYEFVELDNGDYLKVTEACMRIFDRQDFLRVNRARARIKVLIDKIGIDAFRELVEEELEGDWVAERDFSLDGILLRASTRRPTRPRPRAGYASANGDQPGVRPLPGLQRRAPAPAGLQHRRGQGPPRRPDARAAARARPRSCAATPAATARTTVHQNLVLRWVRDESVYEVWRALRRARARRRRRRRDLRRASAAPAPTPASSGSPARWGSTRRSRSGSPRWSIDDPLTRRIHIKIERLPQRLRPAPHRRHRLLRRLDQGRRATRSRPTSRTSAGPTRAARSATASG